MLLPRRRTMTREEVLCRYRHLRAISTRHHSAALKFLVRPTIMEHAQRLGLTKGKVLVAESEEELGLVVTDMLRKVEAWLVDESLEATAPDGTAFACRLCNPESFAMTSGVVVPLDRDLLDEISADFLDLLASHHTQATRLADDPHFATAIYRAAIDQGV